MIIICPVQSREFLLLPAAEFEEAEGITVTHITSAGPAHYNGVRIFFFFSLSTNSMLFYFSDRGAAATSGAPPG